MMQTLICSSGWKAERKLKDISVPSQRQIGHAKAGRRFGVAWVMFALALAVHVTDEATHDFLSTYNPSVRAIRARLPFLPLPTFTFRTWLTLLIAGIILLLCLSPWAFRGAAWLRIVAQPLGIIVGIFNATLHIGSSIYFHRWMPGVYSSPLLLAGAIFLLASARARDFHVRVQASVTAAASTSADHTSV